MAEARDGDAQGNGGGRTKQVIVRPVVNAVRILRHLSEIGRPQRAAQIAKDLAINTSTCFNILRTLASESVLEFDPLSKTYTIGFGIVKIAEGVMSEGERVSAARPCMQEFAERYGITVTLWKRIAGNRIGQVAVEYCSRETRIQVAPGRRGPILMGATGRLLAMQLGMSKADLADAFKTVRWVRPLAFEDYWQQVETAAARGWAVDDGYFSTGTTNVAASVLDPSGSFAFSVVAIMFRGQYDEDGIERIGNDLKALAQRLTTILF